MLDYEKTIQHMEHYSMQLYGIGRHTCIEIENFILTGDMSAAVCESEYMTCALRRMFALYRASRLLFEAADRLDTAYCGGELLLYGERATDF